MTDKQLCKNCDGAGSVPTGIDEFPEGSCMRCNGDGYEPASSPAMNTASPTYHLDELANIQQLLERISNRTPAPNASSANPFAARRYTIADASGDAKMALMSLQCVLAAPVDQGSATSGEEAMRAINKLKLRVAALEDEVWADEQTIINLRAALAASAEQMGGAQVAIPTGWVTDPDSIPLKVVDECRRAICREFGNNGTDGYYKRILKTVFAAIATPVTESVAEPTDRASKNPHNDHLAQYWQAGFDGKEICPTTRCNALAAYSEGIKSRAAEGAATSERKPDAQAS